jgi:hypothetical protein
MLSASTVAAMSSLATTTSVTAMRALAHRRVVASRAGDHAAQAEIVQNLGPVAAIDDGAVLGDVDRHVNLLAGQDALLQVGVFGLAQHREQVGLGPALRSPRVTLAANCATAFRSNASSLIDQAIADAPSGVTAF